MTTDAPSAPAGAQQLRDKIEAAERRNTARSLSDQVRRARDEVVDFSKEHPITSVLGGLALGVIVASLVPGPGRRLRKKATARSAVLAGTIADLAARYGSELLESASKAARASQDAIGDIGSSAASGAKSLGRDMSEVADTAARRASSAARGLRSRLPH